MANAKKCDRCKKYYDASNRNVRLARSYWYEGPGEICYDLCPECEKKFDIFMNGTELKESKTEHTL